MSPSHPYWYKPLSLLQNLVNLNVRDSWSSDIDIRLFVSNFSAIKPFSCSNAVYKSMDIWVVFSVLTDEVEFVCLVTH